MTEALAPGSSALRIDPPGRGPHTCGGCTLCCKVLGVEELGKPTDRWCAHAHKGEGCRIYDARPHTCRTFRCLWLERGLPMEARPDRIHGVLTTTEDGEHLVLHEDPGWPGFASAALGPFLAGLVRDQHGVVVIRCGATQRTLGVPV